LTSAIETMLCVYAPDCTDFSSNGLGTISQSSALVTESLNGEYELEDVHPLDDVGKWHRLVKGNIIRAPVPAGVTPQEALSYKEYSEGKAMDVLQPMQYSWRQDKQTPVL
jgi:hypothetical protein